MFTLNRIALRRCGGKANYKVFERFLKQLFQDRVIIY